MRNFILFSLLTVFLTFTFACNDQSNANKDPNATPEVKKGAKPIADDEIAVIEMENTAAYGTIKIELYSNIAPKAVARFKELAKEGFYNGVTFHRVNQSVIQGGDPNTKDNNPNNDGQGKSDKPNVDAEFSDIPYNTGIVGAARGPDFNSANSQFFITLRREPGFDNKYTIFGKVIEGMSHARIIAAVTPKGGPRGERPKADIKIKEIKIQAK